MTGGNQQQCKESGHLEALQDEVLAAFGLWLPSFVCLARGRPSGETCFLCSVHPKLNLVQEGQVDNAPQCASQYDTILVFKR
jgi:hypothetical protein